MCSDIIREWDHALKKKSQSDELEGGVVSINLCSTAAAITTKPFKCKIYTMEGKQASCLFNHQLYGCNGEARHGGRGEGRLGEGLSDCLCSVWGRTITS